MNKALSILVVLAVLAAVAVGLYEYALADRVTVRNESGQALAEFQIVVLDETLEFDGLEPGEEATQRYRMQGDGEFAAAGSLADGTPVEGRYGYANGPDTGAEVVVVVGSEGTLSWSG